ncbi:MAG: EthD domain-containing protein, partial [Candidatus Binatia bacterium]
NDQLRATRGGPEPYAGLTEAWFDRYDLVKILGDATSEGARGFEAFLEDEKGFIDFERSTLFAAKEIVFVDEGTS